MVNNIPQKSQKQVTIKEEKIMAKKVTRTVITTKATALCIDLKKVEPYNDTIIIPGSFSVSDKKLETKAHEFYDNDSRKIVQIQSVEQEEKIFGMTEELFMKYAQELDEKRHFIDTEEQEPVEE